MLTKGEAEKSYIQNQMKAQNAKQPEELFADARIKEMYSDIEQTYIHLHQLGYRRMPPEMYSKTPRFRFMVKNTKKSTICLWS